MPNLNVSVRAATLEQVQAEAKATGMTVSAWVDRTLSAAIWTQRFARQQARNVELGVTQEWLAGEYEALQARRASG